MAEVVRARRRPPGEAEARRVLPPELVALFAAMPPEDRRHGLAVVATLEAGGWRDDILLAAALLHDVGKAGAGVGILHRTARVLLRGIGPLWRRVAGCPTGWRRPFWVVAHHPERGAVWIEARGGPQQVADLVRYHEAKAPGEWGPDMKAWHAALAAADRGYPGRVARRGQRDALSLGAAASDPSGAAHQEMGSHDQGA